MTKIDAAIEKAPCRNLTELLRCPLSGAPMRRKGNAYLSDLPSAPTFNIEEGVLQALPSSLDKATQTIQSYYDQHPWPKYDADFSLDRLIEESLADAFVESLNRSLAPNSTVLDVGCGTGHLSNFLGIVGRRVLGIDLSWECLLHAQAFNRKNARGSNVTFAQMDLMAAPLAAGSFDAVICDCTLQNAAKPETAFMSAARFVKPGGFILIRMDRRLALLPHRVWQKTIATSTPPYESTHAVGDILRWFELGGFEFISSIPTMKIGMRTEFDYRKSLLDPTVCGSGLDRLAVQFQLLLKRDGDRRFVMVGRKK